MPKILTIWVLSGIFLLFTIPTGAEFYWDRITANADFTDGEEVETDLRFYSIFDWKQVKLELTNKFSWPENNENYSQFNIKAGFKNIQQLTAEMDYRWNQCYSIITPNLSYDFKPWRGIKIGLDYEYERRDSEFENRRYQLNSETISFDYHKNNWNYKFEYQQVQKDYAIFSAYTYDKQQLDQELAWEINPDLKVNCFYCESTTIHPEDIDLSEDKWTGETGLGLECRFNNAWNLETYFSAYQEEKGLEPYLDKSDFKIKCRYKIKKNQEIFLRFGLTNYDYYSEVTYEDPDLPVEEDPKSRIERKMALEYHCKFGKLATETGLFWRFYDYVSAEVTDVKASGATSLLYLDIGKLSLELEIAPQGNFWRNNGFYQLKAEYKF